MKNFYEIKYDSKDISPNSFGIRELSDLLKNIENIFLPLIQRENPNIKSEDVIISLIGIKRGSARYQFTTKCKTNAFLAISQALTNSNFNNIPDTSLNALISLCDSSKKHKCNIHLKDDPEDKKSNIIITPDTIIPKRVTNYLQGETIIYGKIERVGGKTTPKISLTLVNGDSLNCDVNQEMAIKLGHFLYSTVRLKGIAKWDSNNYSIISFEVNEILEYEETSFIDAVNGLSTLLIDYYKSIDNVEDYIHNIREEREP